MKPRIIIGSDHAAVAFKAEMVEHMKGLGVEVMDVGVHEVKRVDYPDIARDICAKVQEGGENTFGVAICGTGIGISIACNKINGIRAALCHDHYTAKLCRQHNDANVVAMGARVIGPEVGKDIIDAFLASDFEGGRHADRVGKITALESSK